MPSTDLIGLLHIQQKKNISGRLFLGWKAHHPDREAAMFLKDRCCAWMALQPVFQCTNGRAIRGRSVSRTGAAAQCCCKGKSTDNLSGRPGRPCQS